LSAVLSEPLQYSQKWTFGKSFSASDLNIRRICLVLLPAEDFKRESSFEDSRFPRNWICEIKDSANSTIDYFDCGTQGAAPPAKM
jgi:hypothetical protein